MKISKRGIIVFVLTLIFTIIPFKITMDLKPWSNPMVTESNPLISLGDPVLMMKLTFVTKMVLSFIIDVLLFDYIPAMIGGIYLMLISMCDTINDLLAPYLSPNELAVVTTTLILVAGYGSLVFMIHRYWKRLSLLERITTLSYSFIGIHILYTYLLSMP